MVKNKAEGLPKEDTVRYPNVASASISDETNDRLQKRAVLEERSPSFVLRKALEESLDKWDKMDKLAETRKARLDEAEAQLEEIRNAWEDEHPGEKFVPPPVKNEANSRLIGGRRYFVTELTKELLLVWRIEVKNSLAALVANAEAKLARIDHTIELLAANHAETVGDLPDTVRVAVTEELTAA